MKDIIKILFENKRYRAILYLCLYFIFFGVNILSFMFFGVKLPLLNIHTLLFSIFVVIDFKKFFEIFKDYDGIYNFELGSKEYIEKSIDYLKSLKLI